MSLFCSDCAPSCPSGFQAPYCEASTLPTSLTSPSPLGSAPLYAPCSFHAASLLRALPLATSSCSVHCPRSSRSWLLRIIQFQLKVTSSETSLITHVKHITLGVIKQTILSYFTRPSLPRVTWNCPCPWLTVWPHLPIPRRALSVLLTTASQHKFLIRRCSKSFCE